MKEFIVLYINSQVICKNCLDILETRWGNDEHNTLKIIHGDSRNSCPFSGEEKIVSYKIFEIK